MQGLCADLCKKDSGSLRSVPIEVHYSLYIVSHIINRAQETVQNLTIVGTIRYNQTLTWHKTASAQSKSFLATTFVSYLSFIGIRWTSVLVVLMSLQVTPI